MKHELVAQLAPFDQQHVLRFWDELSPQQQAALAEQIRAVDLALVQRLFRGGAIHEDWDALATRAVPPPAFRLGGQSNRFSPEAARRHGHGELAAGKVGALLVAGGQGTRLGFDRPKGMFPIGPVSGSSLFQILFEKVLAAGRRDGARVPLYLMTSPATHDATIAYLNAHQRFGLPAEDLWVFCQGTMPAVDAQSGRLLLDQRDRLATSPDGHGGMLAALAKSGGLADMRRRGLSHVFYFQVDNPLAAVCDAEFIGYHVLSGSELSTQVVAKPHALDRVGNVVSVDGQVRIIEYSDLPRKFAEQTGGDGSLRLWAGNTAVHVLDVALLERVAGDPDSLPFHVAQKAVSCIDAQGRRVEPEQPNAIKFERFIFDLLPRARHAVVMEVDSAATFAPVKNAHGEARDTPDTVAAQMIALHSTWLRAVGAQVADDVPVEISPLFALDEQQLTARLAPGRRVTEPTYFH